MPVFDLNELINKIAPVVIDRLKQQALGGLERALREHGEEFVKQLFDRVIPEIRNRLIATITPEPPASFQAELIALGWTIDDTQTRALWYSVFRTLSNALPPEPRLENGNAPAAAPPAELTTEKT